MDAILQAVSTVGFPIVMCGGLLWYIKYTNDQHRTELKEINERHDKEVTALTSQHNNELKEVTKAIENNTIALQRLVDKLGGGIDVKTSA